MAALSFQPFVLRSFNAPLGVDFLRNLGAKISPFFDCERDRLFAYISASTRRTLRQKRIEKTLGAKRREKQQQRAEEKMKQMQAKPSCRERERESKMKVKAKATQNNNGGKK